MTKRQIRPQRLFAISLIINDDDPGLISIFMISQVAVHFSQVCAMISSVARHQAPDREKQQNGPLLTSIFEASKNGLGNVKQRFVPPRTPQGELCPFYARKKTRKMKKWRLI